MKKLRSQKVLQKPEWSSVRALYKAMGFSDYDFDNRPLIGVLNTYNTGNPGHFNLNQVAEFVIKGILQAGGTPVEAGIIGPCDGMGCGNSGMKFILPSRELIADSVETIAELQHLDGMVLLGSCDKVIPGLLIAAARENIPTIVVNGGPALGGMYFDGRASDNSSMVEALAMLREGKITEGLYDELEDRSNPTCGSCSFLGTANTMCAISEALGMMLPKSALVPAVYAERLRVAQRSGQRIVEMVREGLTARKIITRDGLENALRLGMAIGGSTNMALHFPAIAYAADVDFGMADIDRIGRTTPHIANIYPNGHKNVPDFYEAGGVMSVMKNLEPLLHLGTMLCTGSRLGEFLHSIPAIENEIIHSIEHAFHKNGSLAVVKGNLAPDGGITKPTAIDPSMLYFKGIAKCFDSEEEATKAVEKNEIADGTVLIIRYEGPKGGPGMREMVRIMKQLYGQGKALTTAVVTDGRFSGTNNGCFVGHVSPEAAEGGTIAYVKDGDEITIDINHGKLEVNVSDSELSWRRTSIRPKEMEKLSGYLAKYSKLVHSAAGGALVY
ncbi:MAG: dihydroxy-acid dehydratase [Stomatobaculum sp.]